MSEKGTWGQGTKLLNPAFVNWSRYLQCNACKQPTLKACFSALASVKFKAMEGGSMCHRMMSSISDHYQLNVQMGQAEMSPDIAKHPLDRWESHNPVENPWLRGTTSFIWWSGLQIPFLCSETFKECSITSKQNLDFLSWHIRPSSIWCLHISQIYTWSAHCSHLKNNKFIYYLYSSGSMTNLRYSLII